ncbi:stress response protein NST1-like isoform X2 [Cimex lectularius]|uniref:Uncharacterized protein n=1 Tax=Cimex lectularius TaxID=79782 RepID=A0A8I6S138_CIMLE|nr:stress response protein NST1-like isoform X2 [Cimex lectularius]
METDQKIGHKNRDCLGSYQANKKTFDQNSSQELQNAVESYLDSLSKDQEEISDPKIKKQQKHLQELLDSYKKLCSKLDQQVERDEKGANFKPFDVNPTQPEIYALLHPELYKDVREEEKNRLISKFSTKRIFSDAERVIPPVITPSYSISDIRQKEKERFIRLIASAPARFHNTIDGTPRLKSRKFVPYTPQYTENIRESEKERLARIFATSAAFLKRPNLQKRIIGRNLLKNFNSDVCDGSQTKLDAVDKKQDKQTPKLNGQAKNEMVRTGEYSPLNRNFHARGRTVLGVGEHDEQKRMLDAERHCEYVNYMEKVNQNKIDKAVMVKEREASTRVSSAATQTDDSIVEDDHQDDHVQTLQASPEKDPVAVFSPRQKLISDLYGTPYFSQPRPSSSLRILQEHRRKQVEYAEALRQQIEEKKKIVDEQKQREREDEEMIDKMVQEQSRRQELEYVKEQNQKLDWIQQRQAQEEVLRRKLLEMSLEAKELKRQEKLRRIQGERRVTVAPPKQTQQNAAQRQYSHRPLVSNKPTAQEEADKDLREFDERPVMPVKKLNAKSLPEKLPKPGWDEIPEKYTENLQGVDLLREYRSQKERMQLPPQVDRASAHPLIVEHRNSSQDNLQAQEEGYVPSVISDETRRSKSVTSYRRQAEELLSAPLEPMIKLPTPSERFSSERSPVSPTLMEGRPPSPVLPAVRSESVLKHNSKILDDKWQVPPSRGLELERTVNHENILSQLGAFRRQLAREHQRLEKRLEQRS